MGKQYTFYSDPGHAWLVVPVAELAALGVVPSSYSPIVDGMAWLEEDCDLAAFMRAKGFDRASCASAQWWVDNVDDVHVQERRTLAPWGGAVGRRLESALTPSGLRTLASWGGVR